MPKLIHKNNLDWKGITHELELYETTNSSDVRDLGFIKQVQAVPFVDKDHVVIYKHIDGYFGLPGGAVLKLAKPQKRPLKEKYLKRRRVR